VPTDLSAWLDREAVTRDTAQPERVAALWATLDRPGDPPAEGAPLPPLWHWLFFWEIRRRSELGPDGHPKLGGFLPDLGRVRRMWAGSRVEFHRALPVGAAIERRSVIESIEEKSGRSGRLVFVTVRHEITGPTGLALTDRQDIVYREPPAPGAGAPPAPPPAPETSDHVESWTADPTLLFRYSALTFNGHRIHYDLPYAQNEENYPGLVVHGPLLATLMAGAAQALAPEKPLASFAFRAMGPVFAGEPFTVHGELEGAVWVRRQDGSYAARGETARD
jgi:3-methylfumaryl-CoA hydratase